MFEDEKFDRAFRVFIWEYHNSISERDTERTKKLILANNDPSHSISKRFHPYREHSEQMGEDYLRAFATVIKPNCDIITESCKNVLIDHLRNQYIKAATTMQNWVGSLYASLGINDEAQLRIGRERALHIYDTSHLKYERKLDVEISKHNLEIERKSDGEKERKALAKLNDLIAKNEEEKRVTKNIQSKEAINKKEFNGTITELAEKALNAYRRKKYRNIKKACEGYAEEYTRDGEPINILSLYTIAKDLNRRAR